MLQLLADVNCEGHATRLFVLLQESSRLEFWDHLEGRLVTFGEVGLAVAAVDSAVWQVCQDRQLVLLTVNRNAKGSDSLEETLRTRVRDDSLPVITIGDEKRFMRDREYARRAADKLLDYLFDLEKFRGTGRLYIP